jgi:Dirigent-like protein
MSTARVRAVLAAGAAAVATAAVLAASGSAAPAHRTLHFVSKSQPAVGFFPYGAPKQGTTLGFGDRISGSDHGTDRGVCTVIGSSLLCNIDVRLSKGTLAVQGTVPQHPHNSPLAVVGGTGAYKGASGTARTTEVDASTTKIEVSLVK